MKESWGHVNKALHENLIDPPIIIGKQNIKL